MASATLTVIAPPAPVVSISFSPAAITLGQSSTLTWSSSSVQSCTASGAWSGSQFTGGSQSVLPSSVGGFTYTLTCSGAGGSASSSAALTVSSPQLLTLHAFGVATDGNNPEGALVQGTDGGFYGTTDLGGTGTNCGATGCGTVFRVGTALEVFGGNVKQVGTETVLHSFVGGVPAAAGSDAANPHAGLIQGSDGNFYGTTAGGGAGSGGTGYGTVFKITPAGAETVLYSFTGGADGQDSIAPLIQGNDGNFYGTTNAGGTGTNCGASGCGTVFRITPAGVKTVLHSFAGGAPAAAGSDAANPHSGLIQGSDGIFYGTTVGGGAGSGGTGYGTVFKITPVGAETVLYSFTGGADGQDSVAPLIQGSDGNFYGTTNTGGTGTNCGASGCGTVFRVTPAGFKTVLHSFAGGANAVAGSDGANPQAGLIQGSDGNFYGTTVGGGTGSGGIGYGTVFQITPSGMETVLYSFTNGSDGANPVAGLVQGTDGNLYGTTGNGGANNGGTVFELVIGGS